MNRMRTSSRQSLTWSALNAVEECRNSNVKGDAAETGLQNGNGQFRPPGAPNPGEDRLASRCGELLYFGGFGPNASANGHHARESSRQELERCNGVTRSVLISGSTT